MISKRAKEYNAGENVEWVNLDGVLRPALLLFVASKSLGKPCYIVFRGLENETSQFVVLNV